MADEYIFELFMREPALQAIPGRVTSITTCGDGRYPLKRPFVGLSFQNLSPHQLDAHVSAIHRRNKKQYEESGIPSGALNHHHPLLSRLVVDIDLPHVEAAENLRLGASIVDAIDHVLLDHFSVADTPIPRYVTKTDNGRYHIYYDVVLVNNKATARFFSLVAKRVAGVAGITIGEVSAIIDSGPTFKQALRMPFTRKRRNVANVYLPDGDCAENLAVYSLSPHVALLRKWFDNPLMFSLLPRTAAAAVDEVPFQLSREVWRDVTQKLVEDVLGLAVFDGFDGATLDPLYGGGSEDKWWALIEVEDEEMQRSRYLLYHYNYRDVRVLDHTLHFVGHFSVVRPLDTDSRQQVTCSPGRPYTLRPVLPPRNLLDLPIVAFGSPRQEFAALCDVRSIVDGMVAFSGISLHAPDAIEVAADMHYTATPARPYLANYYDPEAFDDGDSAARIEIYEAPCGTGKTYMAIKRLHFMSRDLPDETWIIVTPRVSLCEQFIRQTGISRERILYYKDDDSMISGNERVLITTINSLPKFMCQQKWARAAFVLMDETETTVESLCASVQLGHTASARMASLSAVVSLLANSRLSVLIDRDVRLATRMLVALAVIEQRRVVGSNHASPIRRRLYNEGRLDDWLLHPCKGIHVEVRGLHKPRELTYQMLRHSDLLQRLCDDITANRRAIVYETSKQHANALGEFLRVQRPDAHVMVVTADTSASARSALASHPDDYLAEHGVQVLIHTATIGVGISIDSPYFHTLYSIPRHHVDVRTTIQGQERARHPAGGPHRVHYVVEVGVRNSKRCELGWTLEDVFAHTQTRMRREKALMRLFQSSTAYDAGILSLQRTPANLLMATGLHYFTNVSASVYGDEFQRDVARHGATIRESDSSDETAAAKALLASYSECFKSTRKTHRQKRAIAPGDDVETRSKKRKIYRTLLYLDEREMRAAEQCAELSLILEQPQFQARMRRWRAYVDLTADTWDPASQASQHHAETLRDGETSQVHLVERTGVLQMAEAVVTIQQQLGIGRTARIYTQSGTRQLSSAAVASALDRLGRVALSSLPNAHSAYAAARKHNATPKDKVQALCRYINAYFGVTVLRLVRDDATAVLVKAGKRVAWYEWCLPRWTAHLTKRAVVDTGARRPF